MSTRAPRATPGDEVAQAPVGVDRPQQQQHERERGENEEDLDPAARLGEERPRMQEKDRDRDQACGLIARHAQRKLPQQQRGRAGEQHVQEARALQSIAEELEHAGEQQRILGLADHRFPELRSEPVALAACQAVRDAVVVVGEAQPVVRRGVLFEHRDDDEQRERGQDERAPDQPVERPDRPPPHHAAAPDISRKLTTAHEATVMSRCGSRRTSLEALVPPCLACSRYR